MSLKQGAVARLQRTQGGLQGRGAGDALAASLEPTGWMGQPYR